MKFFDKDFEQSLIEKLNNTDDKSQAIVEVIEALNERTHADLIDQLREEQAAGNIAGRQLTKGEKAFYEKIKANQAVTFTQEDIIPTEVIDRTLEDVKKQSNVLSLVNMAPAGVKKWLAGSHTGVGAWGSLTGSLTSELTATITALNIEVNKAYVLLVVPKAVRDLALPLVDRYFRAILAEAMHDVLVKGYLEGNGVTAPIGITYNLPNAEGAVVAKAVHNDMTGFSPAQMAPVKVALSNGSKRAVDKIYLIANPATVYTYIDPALYLQNIAGQFVKACKDDIEVIAEPNLTAGKAIFTLSNVYTMGMNSVRVDEYKEIKVLDDADLFVGKCYANGRPDDDNTAYVIDATQLAPRSEG